MKLLSMLPMMVELTSKFNIPEAKLYQVSHKGKQCSEKNHILNCIHKSKILKKLPTIEAGVYKSIGTE